MSPRLGASTSALCKQTACAEVTLLRQWGVGPPLAGSPSEEGGGIREKAYSPVRQG
jgi:hypothetical protein